MDASKIYAIDLSHNNASFNWNELSPAVKIVILKATQGKSFKDGTFIQNLNTVRTRGLILGAYHFLNFTDSAEDQANNYLSRGVDFSRPGTLSPIVDIENQVPESLDSGVVNNQAAAHELIKEYLEIIEAKTGRKPIIYTYNGFWGPTLGHPDFSSYPLWVANYANVEPHMFGGWDHYTLWQFSESGSHKASSGGDIDWSLLNPSIDINTLL
jgi:lysozyme